MRARIHMYVANSRPPEASQGQIVSRRCAHVFIITGFLLSLVNPVKTASAIQRSVFIKVQFGRGGRLEMLRLVRGDRTAPSISHAQCPEDGTIFPAMIQASR